jgi:hypothetical protein
MPEYSAIAEEERGVEVNDSIDNYEVKDYEYQARQTPPCSYLS